MSDKYNVKEISGNLTKEPEVTYKSSQETDFIKFGREGLPRFILDEMLSFLNISLQEFSSVLPVTVRTLQRYGSEDLLPSNVSDHLVQLFDLFQYGKYVFGANVNFVTWYKTPNTALGNVTPFSLSDTGYGIKMVRNELGRLAYGVYS
jgi:putative toxin-antitoxin system antitoxin component (TIGR02293 family)